MTVKEIAECRPRSPNEARLADAVLRLAAELERYTDSGESTAKDLLREYGFAPAPEEGR